MKNIVKKLPKVAKSIPTFIAMIALVIVLTPVSTVQAKGISGRGDGGSGGGSSSTETLQVPFRNGTQGVKTQSFYSGKVAFVISGTGEAAGDQDSDAFYLLTRQGPIHYSEIYNWVLGIDGVSADYFIDPIPDYREDHTYSVTMTLSTSEQINFCVMDKYTTDHRYTRDNKGSYSVTIIQL